MSVFSLLERDILILMTNGHALSADHLLPITERYRIADRCLSTGAVRTLVARGFIRSMGEHDSCEEFEVTELGRRLLSRA